MEIKPRARLCNFIGNDDLLFRHKDLKLNLAYDVSYLGEFSLNLQEVDDDYERVIAYFSAFPDKTGMLDHPHYAFQFIYRNPGFAAAVKKSVYKFATQPGVEVDRHQFWYTVAHIMKAFMQSMVEVSMLYDDRHKCSQLRNFMFSAYHGIIRQMLEVYIRYTGDLLIKASDYISISQSLFDFGENKKFLKVVSAIYTGNVQPERADLMLHFNCKTHPYLMGSKIRR
jgi:hypothetical protein